MRETLDRLLAETEQFGPVRVDAVKTGINLAARAHFAGARSLRNERRVDFLPERRLDSPRIVRYELLNLPWITA